MAEDSAVEVWLPVIGRALAFLCMRNADMGSKTILEKTQFLQGLGLEIGDAAAMLGSTAASVKEMQRQAKNKVKKRRAKSNGRKKEKRKS